MDCCSFSSIWFLFISISCIIFFISTIPESPLSPSLFQLVGGGPSTSESSSLLFLPLIGSLLSIISSISSS
ncbi:hypothetical protein BGX38DRAFT_1206466 [Terfezia claveryi]|nr:hypothetical protein BGX38DRAFT_1206466 [Terfezia claveryi]